MKRPVEQLHPPNEPTLPIQTPADLWQKSDVLIKQAEVAIQRAQKAVQRSREVGSQTPELFEARDDPCT